MHRRYNLIPLLLLLLYGPLAALPGAGDHPVQARLLATVDAVVPGQVFNIGVELGQLAVIAAAFVLFALPLGRSAIYRRVVVIPGSVAIAFVGLWWAFERSFM